MKRFYTFIVFLFVVILFLVVVFNSLAVMKNQNTSGAYITGIYPNLFNDLLNRSETEIQNKIGQVFNQFFYGNDNSERLYYPVEPDMAYIEDIYNQDVRTEGMSYGMMIAVQLNKKNEFDRLWKWAKTYMQHQSEVRKGYFAWHCQPNGAVIDSNSASDGEEWFVMALFFASARWGDGEGIYNYKLEAQFILDAMLNKTDSSDRTGAVSNMFNRQNKQVVFVPSAGVDDFTDPSYHLPHFYELWARWADKENQFWCDVADSSRQFLKNAAHPQTGLFPDYANFDGTPTDTRWGGGHDDFRYDAWRVGMNIALDYIWFARDDWAIDQSNRLLDFFYSKGIGRYASIFTLDGRKLFDDHSTGLIAMNAVACLASTNSTKKEFIQELWDAEMPDGKYRYYDGLLYLLAMLQVSGNFKIYDPIGHPIPACNE